MATDHSVALRLGCAAIMAAAIPATSAELKDPLSPLTSAKGSILRFRRDYSPSISSSPRSRRQIRTARVTEAGLGYDRPEPAHGSAESDSGRLRLAEGRRD
jgi:hypothetical protein